VDEPPLQRYVDIVNARAQAASNDEARARGWAQSKHWYDRALKFVAAVFAGTAAVLAAAHATEALTAAFAGGSAIIGGLAAMNFGGNAALDFESAAGHKQLQLRYENLLPLLPSLTPDDATRRLDELASEHARVLQGHAAAR
jgi:NO-binding membrane sensor protein with MHYT domain